MFLNDFYLFYALKLSNWWLIIIVPTLRNKSQKCHENNEFNSRIFIQNNFLSKSCERIV